MKSIIASKQMIFVCVLLLCAAVVGRAWAQANQLQNGDFSNGTNGWWSATNNGATHTMAVNAAQELCHTISAPGIDPWDIVVGQDNLNMVSGQWYEIAFDAYASVDRTINFKTGLGSAPYTDYFVTTANLTTTPQRITVAFNNVVSDPATQFQFHLGGTAGEVCIDNVSVMTTIEPTPVPYTTQSQSGQPLRAYDGQINIGSAVDSGIFLSDATHNAILANEFNLFTPVNAMKMEPLVGTRNNYDWAVADAMVDFAEDNNMAFHGHALVWHIQQPGWIENGTFSQAEMLDEMYSHIDTVMGRYAGRILYWDVVNEAVHTTNGNETGDAPYALRSTIWHDRIGSDYIDLAFERARLADPTAVLLYNDYNISQMGHNKADYVFNMVKELVQNEGTPIDQVGMQMHYDVAQPPNVQAVIDNFARYAAIGVDVQITEIDVRIALPATQAELDAQADVYRQMLRACLDAPNCDNFTTWGLSDIDSWIPGWFTGYGDAHLYDATYTAKPAYHALIDELESSPAVTATPSPTPADPTMTPTPTPTTTPDNNLVQNGMFGNGGDGWETYETDGAVHTVVYANDEACLSLSAVGTNPWSVALRQSVALEQGQAYELTYTLRADETTQFRMRLGSPVDPYPDYFVATVTAGTSTTPITHPFTMDAASDAAASIDFQVGAEAATTICFGDISLVEVNGNNAPLNTTLSDTESAGSFPFALLVFALLLTLTAQIGIRRTLANLKIGQLSASELY